MKTDDGKVLYLRKEPQKRGEVVGRIPYGAKVELDWSYAGNDGWSRVKWNNKEGFVQTRYLVNEDPGPYKKPTKAPGTPKPTKDPKKEAEELKKKQAELNKELENQVEVKPYYIAVRPTRASGWVNVYVGPGTITAKNASYAANKELIVLCETLNWLQARDPETGKVVGYIQKSMTAPITAAPVTQAPATPTEKPTVWTEWSKDITAPNGAIEMQTKTQYSYRKVDLKVSSGNGGGMSESDLYQSLSMEAENVKASGNWDWYDISITSEWGPWMNNSWNIEDYKLGYIPNQYTKCSVKERDGEIVSVLTSNLTYHYTISYKRYGEWTDWTDSQLSGYDEERTRVLYRYLY